VVVIRRVCGYCTVLHVMGGVCGGVILWEAMGSGVWSMQWGWVGLALVGVLVGGQVVLKSKTYALDGPEEKGEAAGVVEERPAVAVAPVAAVAAAAPAAAVGVAAGRRVLLYRKRVTLGVDEWPIFGPAEAQHVVAELFDYTCPDCRHMHQLLGEVRRRYGNRLAILRVPVPLHPECNPAVPVADPRHGQACMMARLALAVWVAEAEKFEEFDRWLFERHGASAAEARKEAERLVGVEVLRGALGSAAVARRLEGGVGLYRMLGAHKLPELLLPEALLWGRVPGIEDLMQILESQLKAAPAVRTGASSGG
jgi:protein-disulfide isomerase